MLIQETSVNSPFVFIIFGATGDLAHNKLIPSLFSLFKEGRLPKDFLIIGFSRREITDLEFRNSFDDFKRFKDWKNFSKHLQYQNGDFNNTDGYLSLIEKLNKYDTLMGACITRFFYLATPPNNYDSILHFLHSTKLSEGCGQGSSKWTRIIIEKPFGKDLKTAIALDRRLAKIFEEKQIFRVDHYLGKETVQNVLAFRFANPMFEPVWNKTYIDHVQITFAEQKGIERRGRFFDGVGILRDVGQNHLMQVLAAVAMERPNSFSKEEVRNERAKVIKAIERIKIENISKQVVRGQFKNYLNEEGVDKKSKTETFTALKIFLTTKRFIGVPFYLRVGKKMPKDSVLVSVIFKKTDHELFPEKYANVLTIRIQPNEGIVLRLVAKNPGAKLSLRDVFMKFYYQEEFQSKGMEAYEKILLDIFAGDQMLFNRSDELSSSWRFITNILNGWAKQKGKVAIYDEGTWGPKEAFDLIEKDGRKWIEA